MIDVKQPVRKSYYDLLNGAITFAGDPVPVVDDVKKLGDSSTLYVLLSNQSGADSSTFQTFDSDETIVLDIVFKSGARVNKETVDNIAGQIFSLLLPTPGVTGLTSPPGTQINCVRLKDDRYLTLTLNSSNSVVRRLLTLSMHVRQTQSPAAIPPNIQNFRNPVTSADFATETGYVNTWLKGKTFSLFLNDVPKFLNAGVDWDYNPAGGFNIFIPNFNATLNNYTIYVLLI